MKTNSAPKETWLSSFIWKEILLAEIYIKSKACYTEDSVTKIQNLTKHTPIIGCVLHVMYTWQLNMSSGWQYIYADNNSR